MVFLPVKGARTSLLAGGTQEDLSVMANYLTGGSNWIGSQNFGYLKKMKRSDEVSQRVKKAYRRVIQTSWQKNREVEKTGALSQWPETSPSISLR